MRILRKKIRKLSRKNVNGIVCLIVVILLIITCLGVNVSTDNVHLSYKNAQKCVSELINRLVNTNTITDNNIPVDNSKDKQANFKKEFNQQNKNKQLSNNNDQTTENSDDYKNIDEIDKNSVNLINDKIKKNLNKYIDDIQKNTAFRISPYQKKLLTNYINTKAIYKLKPETISVRRERFSKLRRKLVRDWEGHYNANWNVYSKDVIINGSVKRHAGQQYDAHHIIELSYNGPNEWWNIVPAAYPNQHQGGIHRKSGVCSEIFEAIPMYD